MAYNPFSIFRRNQKALFAVLTVFIMIMFTLSFGSGDFFERFARWIGSKGKGDAVCKIDGDTIKDSELSKVRRGRIMANTFMSLAAGETARYVREYANQQQSKLSEEGQQMARVASQAESFLSQPEFLRNPQLGRFIQQAIREAEFAIARIIDNPNAKSEDRDVARAFRTLLELRALSLQPDEGLYFLNAPNKTNRDTIEFLLWEKKADQLGIRFTKEDVLVLLNREFYGFFKRDVEVRKAMRERMEGFNMDACLDALATEFKVRTAQAVVMGHPDPGNTRRIGPPMFGSPYEMFEYYRQQCSPATYDVIAVPALAFTDKVVGEPTEAELNEFYKKYQDDEPNPGKETFGFKEPRKLSISWIAITGTEPYYEKLAAEQVKVGEAMAKGSGLLTVPLPGMGAGWAMAAAAPLALKEPAVDAAYSSYKYEFELRLSAERFGAYERHTIFTRDLLPTSTVRPGTMAALLGGMAGQSAPFGHPAVAASIAMGAPIAYEIRDRIKVGLPLVLGTVPGPAAFQTTIAGAASAKAAEPKPLPIEAMRPELIKTTVTGRAKALAQGDVTKFVEELEKLSEKGKPKDKAAVEKYIAEFKATRGLTKQGEQFGSTLAPRDEWTIEEDEGLKPLVNVQKESLGRARGPHGGNQYIPFGRSFFWTSQPVPGGFAKRVPTAGVYSAKPFPPEDRAAPRADGRPQYVYWATEDVNPKKTNLITARDTVREAWKRMKVRELAAAHANKIADAIRAASGDSPAIVQQAVADEAFRFQSQIAVNNDKAYRRARMFTISDVCPLAPMDPLNPEAFQAGVSPIGRVQPFLLPDTENIPYPTDEMEKALVDARDKPAKTVLVLPDGPKDTYYVATLIKRELKTPEEFKRYVYAPNGPARNIIGLFMRETANKSRRSIVDLLKNEFKYAETEEQKKKLDDNAKSGGRD